MSNKGLELPTSLETLELSFRTPEVLKSLLRTTLTSQTSGELLAHLGASTAMQIASRKVSALFTRPGIREPSQVIQSDRIFIESKTRAYEPCHF